MTAQYFILSIFAAVIAGLIVAWLSSLFFQKTSDTQTTIREVPSAPEPEEDTASTNRVAISGPRKIPRDRFFLIQTPLWFVASVIPSFFLEIDASYGFAEALVMISGFFGLSLFIGTIIRLVRWRRYGKATHN